MNNLITIPKKDKNEKIDGFINRISSDSYALISQRKGQISIESVIDFLQDKTIAVVGNNMGIMKYAHGDFIDSHDIVIRMNKATLEGNEHKLGTRTDVWACSINNQYDQLRMFNYYDKKIQMILYLAAHINHQIVEPILKKTYQENIYSYIELVKKINAKPSTGLMVMHFLARNIPNIKVTMIGFDFFKTNTWYNEARGKHCFVHNINGEEEKYMNEIMDEIGVNFVRT